MEEKKRAQLTSVKGKSEPASAGLTMVTSGLPVGNRVTQQPPANQGRPNCKPRADTAMRRPEAASTVHDISMAGLFAYRFFLLANSIKSHIPFCLSFSPSLSPSIDHPRPAPRALHHDRGLSCDWGGQVSGCQAPVGYSTLGFLLLALLDTCTSILDRFG